MLRWNLFPVVTGLDPAISVNAVQIPGSSPGMTLFS